MNRNPLVMPLGLALQRLPGKPGPYMGWHSMLTPLDLTQYLSLDDEVDAIKDALSTHNNDA